MMTEKENFIQNRKELYKQAVNKCNELKENIKEEIESVNFIQIKKSNIVKIGIKDENGVDTGEHLEFDLEDINLPLRLNECDEKHRKNLEFLRDQFIIIDKKEDKKGKKILSWKEEEKLKVLQEFYKREMGALDLFLGENGTKKLLNGRKPYYSMYEDINDMLEPILPKLKLRADDIANRIKEKYSNKMNDDKDVLKLDDIKKGIQKQFMGDEINE